MHRRRLNRAWNSRERGKGGGEEGWEAAGGVRNRGGGEEPKLPAKPASARRERGKGVMGRGGRGTRGPASAEGRKRQSSSIYIYIYIVFVVQIIGAIYFLFLINSTAFLCVELIYTISNDWSYSRVFPFDLIYLFTFDNMINHVLSFQLYTIISVCASLATLYNMALNKEFLNSQNYFIFTRYLLG